MCKKFKSVEMFQLSVHALGLWLWYYINFVCLFFQSTKDSRWCCLSGRSGFCVEEVVARIRCIYHVFVDLSTFVWISVFVKTFVI